MIDNNSGVNPLDALAEEFVARYRRGERPSLSEYVAKYPELAGDVRDLFPGLVLMEDIRPESGATTRPFAGTAAGARPERLGDYRILREVGRGGMGIVYEAEQLSLGRHIALKVLPAAGLMNPTFLERFRREAKAAARLHHTNIVPVYGVGEADGIHFYAMQFIQGQSLDQVLHDVRQLRRQSGVEFGEVDPTRTRFEQSVAPGLLTGQFEMLPAALSAGADASEENTPPAAPLANERGGAESGASTGLSAGSSEMPYFRSVARIGLQAAEALAYAHRQGILHRDVKPSNLLLDQQGTVWITDFGLAKAEGADELTHTGDIVGTVRFMAPERFEGRSLLQSDVYSLGLTLYEMLTLRPAFNDSNRALLIQNVLNQPPTPPRRIDPNIPRDLETIVLTCLSKDPQGRYANSETLADDLRRFLSDRPIRARRASLVEQAWRWCRRNPVMASLLAAVVLLLIIIAVRSTFSAARLQSALTRAEEAEREARLREADALVDQAHGTRYSRRSGQRFKALAALQKAAAIGHGLEQPPHWFDRLRNEAIAALALPDIHMAQIWNGFPHGTWRADVSHDFELYARTTRKGACSIRRIADDSEIAALPALGEPATATFGPGRLLTLLGESSYRVQLWDLKGQEPILRLDEPPVVVIRGASFSADGKLLALSYNDGSLRVYETDKGICRYRLAPNRITAECRTQLHPMGSFVATFSYWSNLLQVRDLRSGEVRVELKLPWHGSGLCAWNPDGLTLAAVDGDRLRIHLYAFDPAHPSLRLTRTLQISDNGGTAVCFNPAGDRLAARGWSGRVHLFDAVNGRLLFSTHALAPPSWAELHFNPSGDRLAAARVSSQQHQIGVWSVADAREYRALIHPGPGRRRPEWFHAVHPDGRLAAVGLRDGLALFDLQSGCERAFAFIPGGGGYTCFDGDGNLYLSNGIGLYRWPVRPDPTQLNRLIVGPPEPLPFYAGGRCLAASHDGRVIALSNFTYEETNGGGWVLHPKDPKPRRIEKARNRLASVSPDGRWAVFGFNQNDFKVYETATGRCVHQSPADSYNYARFSPDGRWLVTDNDGGRVYTVGTWEPGIQLGLGIPCDVSPDSQLVVMGQKDGIYRLVELATGQELARLEDPDQLSAPAVFTPDGTCLVASAEDGLRVWDLRRIRRKLDNLGLDWGALPYPEATSEAPVPLDVKIIGEDALIPSDPTGLNGLARDLITGPADEREPAQALKLIQKALQKQPENALYLNTLGIVQYHKGQYADAVATLERSLRAGQGEFAALDLFCLAMCHAKLGAPAKAKECFNRAVSWGENNKGLKPIPHHRELAAFRAEAEAVLGLK